VQERPDSGQVDRILLVYADPQSIANTDLPLSQGTGRKLQHTPGGGYSPGHPVGRKMTHDLQHLALGIQEDDIQRVFHAESMYAGTRRNKQPSLLSGWECAQEPGQAGQEFCGGGNVIWQTKILSLIENGHGNLRYSRFLAA